MNRIIISLILTMIFRTITIGFSHAADSISHPVEMPHLDCSTCHTCSAPTVAQPCLQPCTRLMMSRATGTHELSEAPDSALLDQLADLYQPVHFNHKLHAGMAQMGNDCATCHHYSPPGHISPCRECHGGETNPNNLRQPGLKGAYHRQCLSCHREWSHNTKCVVCHLPQPGKAMDAAAQDSSDIMGISHPKIIEPDRRIYQTPYAAGPVVTFYHQEHIELFGLRCVDCHQQESCSRCHDLERPVKVARTQEEIHATCNSCHAKDRCNKCHDTKERPAFTHAATGWELSRYHKGLECRACHPTGRRIGRLTMACAACHAGWNQENFSHAVTGLQLDETHAQLECTECHAGRHYNSPPNCASCHDDGRTPKSTPPGKTVPTRG